MWTWYVCTGNKFQSKTQNTNSKLVSKPVWYFTFISHGRKIKCRVVERRRRSPLLQGGLEVSCSVTVIGKML